MLCWFCAILNNLITSLVWFYKQQQSVYDFYCIFENCLMKNINVINMAIINCHLTKSKVLKATSISFFFLAMILSAWYHPFHFMSSTIVWLLLWCDHLIICFQLLPFLLSNTCRLLTVWCWQILQPSHRERTLKGGEGEEKRNLAILFFFLVRLSVCSNYIAKKKLRN